MPGYRYGDRDRDWDDRDRSWNREWRRSDTSYNWQAPRWRSPRPSKFIRKLQEELRTLKASVEAGKRPLPDESGRRLPPGESPPGMPAGAPPGTPPDLRAPSYVDSFAHPGPGDRAFPPEAYEPVRGQKTARQPCQMPHHKIWVTCNPSKT